MPKFDLYAESTNPSPDQLFGVCREFSAFLAKSKEQIWSRNFTSVIYFQGGTDPSESKAGVAPIRPEDLLISAEKLAEQIIGHYGGLAAVSTELTGFGDSDLRLPTEALDIFLYACAREHESLSVMLNEMDILYGDQCDKKSSQLIREFMRDTTLIDIPRPALWSYDGGLKYSPSAFRQIHHKEMANEVAYLCSTGSDGVQKILFEYPKIDQRSKDHFDLLMGSWVNNSSIALDDPRRKLLAHILDPVKEGRAVLQRLFEMIGESTEESLFQARLQHVINIVRSLPTEKSGSVLQGVTQCINMWTEEPNEDDDIFSGPGFVVPRLVMILSKVSEFGYCALEAVGRHACLEVADITDKKRVERILDRELSGGVDHLSPHAAWREAVLLTLDEDFLVGLGLGEQHLGALYARRGTPKLRNKLMSTDRGRDLIIGHDLGL